MGDMPWSDKRKMYVPEIMERIGKGQVDDALKAEIAKGLLRWTPECPAIGAHLKGYQKGDDDAPFMSETYLYLLLGKEDARTLLALMRPVWALLGVPRDEQP